MEISPFYAYIRYRRVGNLVGPRVSTSITILNIGFIQYYVGTVFIRIVAAATINFSLAGVRLLIEGGFY